MNMNSPGGSGGAFRPRGALARALYDKQQNDSRLRVVNQTEWYRCNLDAMSENVRLSFHQLGPDEDTRAFIANSIDKSSWLWTQMWYSLMLNVLGFFMTKTDINGWLGRGSMFVLSRAQLAELALEARARSALLDGCADDPRRLRHERAARQPDATAAADEASRLGGTLVDLGAGDGEVTARWRQLFDRACATEISASMRRLLDAKGFEVLDADNWWTHQKFSAISMLNLLDRCSQPRSMLLTARQALDDDGLVIVALVLPFKPFVENSSDHSPLEQLPIFGDTFEQQVESFVEFVKTDIGLEVLVWTRVPYLCEGDMTQSYYWLDDAIFLMRKIP